MGHFYLNNQFYSPYSTEFDLTEDFNPVLLTRRWAFQNRSHSYMLLAEIQMDPAFCKRPILHFISSDSTTLSS